MTLIFRSKSGYQQRAQFSELNRPGVYLLLGLGQGSPSDLVDYIDGSENAAGRLLRHANGGKAFGFGRGS
jgi:hypothetical protein